MKIFYIENESDPSHKIPLQLEAELVCTVFEAESELKAVHWLKSNDISDLDLIIFNDSNSGHLSNQLYRFIKGYCSHVPVLLITKQHPLDSLDEYKTFFSDHPYNAVISRDEGMKPVIDHVVKVSSLIQSIPQAHYSSAYCRVSYSRLRVLDRLYSDIYIQISDNKFVKIFKENELRANCLFDHYLAKGVSNFFILKKDFAIFSKKYDQFFNHKLKVNPFLKENKEIHLKIFENVQDYILNLGLDEATVARISQISELTILLLLKEPNLKEIIHTVMKKDNYLSEHSLMISYISNAIALEIDWVSDFTLEKLSAASILHDACFFDCDLAKVSQMQEEEWKGVLARKDVEMIRTHPYKMFEVTRKADNIQSYVDLIIYSHHERMNGDGYPRHLNWSHIYPLAALFIVAEDFVHGIYGKILKSSEIAELISIMKTRYTKGTFKKSVEALESIFVFKHGHITKT